MLLLDEPQVIPTSGINCPSLTLLYALSTIR